MIERVDTNGIRCSALAILMLVTFGAFGCSALANRGCDMPRDCGKIGCPPCQPGHPPSSTSPTLGELSPACASDPNGGATVLGSRAR